MALVLSLMLLLTGALFVAVGMFEKGSLWVRGLTVVWGLVFVFFALVLLGGTL